VVLDLEACTLTSRAGTVPVAVADGPRQQFLAGTWDATSVLLEAGDAIEKTARSIPYVSGFEA